jgi:hypothetical protein
LKFHQGSVRGVAFSPKVGISIFKYNYSIDDSNRNILNPAVHLFCMAWNISPSEGQAGTEGVREQSFAEEKWSNRGSEKIT